MSTLAALWSARCIAVIGATERPGAIGRLPIEYLQRYGYQGRIIPVNPKGGSILGLPAVTSIAEADEHVELALVMVPAPIVPDAVAQCAAAGVDVCVVMSSGFAEADDDGARVQAELVETARAAGMRLVGPNCIGSVGGPDAVMATFSPVFSSPATPLPTGSLALVSQSGALGFGAMSLGLERGVPIGITVTTGNEADVSAVEVAAALAEDPSVSAIMMYVESLTDISTLARAAQLKPIAMVKAGRSAAGAEAAASHTGALAAPDAVVDSALAATGIARVADIDALLDAGMAIASGKAMKGDRVAIITTSGGSGILAADALDASSLNLAVLQAETVTDLEQIVPSYGNATNPVDVTAAVMAEPGLFERCVNRLAQDADVDAIIACFAVLVGDDVARIAHALKAASVASGLPVVAARTGSAALAPEGSAILAAAGIATYPTPERAVRALEAVRARGRTAASVSRTLGPELSVPNSDASEKELKAALGGIGLPIPESILTDSAADAIAAVSAVGGRAVFKAVVPGLAHKSDVGGVLLDITANDAEASFDQLRALGGSVLVERFVPGGVEVLVGIAPSPLGQVLTIGVGGVLTEIVADAAVHLLPVSASDVEQMIDATVLGRLLAGVRGRPAADRSALVRTILGLADAVRGWPTGYELELNPVTVLTDGCWVLDAMYSAAGAAQEKEMVH